MVRKPEIKPSDHYIVGIGASAGGLEAFEQFFTNIPPENGMSFILVPHLDPTHKSIMTDLLRRYTRMDVVQAEDGMKVAPDKVYIIPPNKDMSIMHKTLRLMEPTAKRGLRHPVDFFFRSLAQDQGEKAICIVLSGTGTEGALGLRMVKGEGGLVVVQDPASAKYDGMPQSAIATGLVDLILPPEKMPKHILRYVKQAGCVAPVKELAKPGKVDYIQKIFLAIRSHTRHDFSLYKHNTVLRRIERRMAINQIADTADYVKYLNENPHEVEALFKELLIRVTNFFRDPEAFDSLKREALPHIFRSTAPGSPVRVWVPGCSTGEEAYSIGMVLTEYMEEVNDRRKVQIFATDIDASAIDIARAAVYADGIAVDVSPDRLTRFFIHKGNSYKVKDDLRESIVFAVQDLVKDPPFSKLDLISCRNLLIYLGPELQKRILPLFRYALNPGGALFLGSSETIGTYSDLFSPLDKKWKLFKTKRGDAASMAHFNIRPLFLDRSVALAEKGKVEFNIGEFSRKLLLESYSPPCAVINDQGEIMYIHGKTGKYLEPAQGKASLNIIEMAREGLKLELRAMVRKATNIKGDVKQEGMRVRSNGGYSPVNVDVRYLNEPEQLQGLLMVVFREAPSLKEEKLSSRKAQAQDMVDGRIAELEQEVKSTKDHLQTTIEELETSNEELKSTNEEMQSSNEELQSTNEELETSKEELQSINEELMTVNAELQSKIDELGQVSNDMANLLAGTQIATIFLDSELKIKRFTPAMKNVINLIETDVGRPINDIASKVEYPELIQDTREVLAKLAGAEREVRDMAGKWYLARILPYRIMENVIDGVVITFIDITTRKTAEEESERRRLLLETVLEYIPDGLSYATAPDDKIQFVSRYGADMTGKPRETLEGIPVSEHKEKWGLYKADGNTKPDENELPLMRAMKGETIKNEKWAIRRPDGTLVPVLCNAGPIFGSDGEIVGGIIAWRDI